MSKAQFAQCCSKPALTLHVKHGYTFTLAAVVLAAAVFCMHLCIFKCRKKKKKKESGCECAG